jgi:hypothetical protein
VKACANPRGSVLAFSSIWVMKSTEKAEVELLLLGEGGGITFGVTVAPTPPGLGPC